MLDFLKQKNDHQPMDVKIIRNKLLQFIKEQLQRREGGEGSNIKGNGAIYRTCTLMKRMSMSPLFIFTILIASKTKKYKE